MFKQNKIYQKLKIIFFYFFDFLIIFLKKNKQNIFFENKNKVIWLAETGTRDFVPRLAQAISLWEDYSIPSLVIHKHFLKKIDRKYLKDSVIIDKSATYNCVNRLRYSKLSGALNIVIPEELLICDKYMSQVKGTLHPKTLNYVDFVICNSKEVIDYLIAMNKKIDQIDVLNPRLCQNTIKKNISKYLLPKINIKKIVNEEFILINDTLSLKFSSFENEFDLLQNQIFKSTGVNSSSYLNNYLNEENEGENLLFKLINQLKKNKMFENIKIIIRPHPSVDLQKYESYFNKKLNNLNNIQIIRKGNVIEWMQESKITFHNNCTSSIEGYYAGIKNIFNFAESLKYGTSERFKKILLPLGIEGSIQKAINYINLENQDNFKEEFNQSKKDKNLYFFLGNAMSKSKSNNLNTSLDKDCLFRKFENERIKEFSPADRWKDAEKRIIYIKKNKKMFDNLNIKPLGLIGVQIGKGF